MGQWLGSTDDENTFLSQCSKQMMWGILGLDRPGGVTELDEGIVGGNGPAVVILVFNDAVDAFVGDDVFSSRVMTNW